MACSFAVLVGFGSLVAVLLATQRPDLVSRLLLVGLPVLPLVHGRGIPLPSMRATLSPEERAAAHRANLAAIMIHDPSQIDEDTVALQMVNAARDRMRARQLVTTDACARAVRMLQCDFECIWGEQDVLCRDRWAEVRAACNFNPLCAHQALIAGGGHWVQYEKAAAFNTLLTKWAVHPSGARPS